MEDQQINNLLIIIAFTQIAQYVVITYLSYITLIQQDDTSKNKKIIAFFAFIWPITYMVLGLMWIVTPKSKAVARVLMVLLMCLTMASCSSTRPVINGIYHVRGTQFKYVKDNGDGTYAAYNLNRNEYIERIGFSYRMKPVITK